MLSVALAPSGIIILCLPGFTFATLLIMYISSGKMSQVFHIQIKNFITLHIFQGNTNKERTININTLNPRHGKLKSSILADLHL